MNTEFEGIFTIETWDGEPNKEGSVLKQSYSGKNGMTKDFKDHWLNAFRRVNLNHLSPADEAFFKKTLGDTYLKDKGFTVDECRTVSFNNMNIYLSEEEGNLSAYKGRLDKTIQGQTGILPSRIYSKVSNASLAHPLTMSAETSITFMRPSVDIYDSNILDILKSLPDVIKTFTENTETLFMKNRSRFETSYGKSGVIGTIHRGIIPPVDLSGKTLEWIQQYESVAIHAPIGVDMNIKNVGLTNLHNASIRVPVTQHTIKGGFKLSATDYLKITYYVLVKTRMPLPATTTNNKTTFLGKEYTYAVSSYMLTSATSFKTAPYIFHHIPEYQNMIHKVATHYYGKEAADVVLQSVKDSTRIVSSYFNSNSSGMGLFDAIKGYGLHNGVAISMRGNNAGFPFESNNMYISPTYELCKYRNTITSKMYDIFVECDPSLPKESYLNKINEYIEAVAETTYFINQYPNSIVDAIAIDNSNSLSAIRTTQNVINTGTELPENGKAYMNIIDAKADTQNVWSARGWYIDVCCPFVGLNIGQIIHFNDVITKDHLNSFKWGTTVSVFNQNSLPDDSGSFLDEIRSNPADTIAKRTLKIVEGK